MSDPNDYFDSEKWFKSQTDPANEPGRRSFLKKMVGAAVAAAVPTLPDPPKKESKFEDVHLRSVGIDMHNSHDVVYSTAAYPQALYTVSPSYSWDENAWFPYQGKLSEEEKMKKVMEYHKNLEEKYALRKGR